MRSLQHVILQTLDKYADLQINLGSESARLDISKDIATAITDEFEESLANDTCYGTIRSMKDTTIKKSSVGFGQV